MNQNRISIRPFGALRVVTVILEHVLMVVVRRVEITKHCDCLDLGPAAPSCNHVNGPTGIPEAMLASAAAERMCPVKRPGFVSESLQVGCERAAENIVALSEFLYRFQPKEDGDPEELTMGCA